MITTTMIMNMSMAITMTTTIIMNRTAIPTLTGTSTARLLKSLA